MTTPIPPPPTPPPPPVRQPLVPLPNKPKLEEVTDKEMRRLENEVTLLEARKVSIQNELENAVKERDEFRTELEAL